MTKEHLSTPCSAHAEVSERLRDIENLAHGIRTTLFGEQNDVRGGLVGEHEIVKSDVKNISRNMWIAFGGIMVVNVTIVPILVGLVLWFLTSTDFGGRRSWLNTETAKCFVSELMRIPKRDQL